MLVSSHLMSEMELTADHLIVIGRGRLLADTTVTELIAQVRPAPWCVPPHGNPCARLLVGQGARVHRRRAWLLQGTGRRDGSVTSPPAASIALHELTPAAPRWRRPIWRPAPNQVDYLSLKEMCTFRGPTGSNVDSCGPPARVDLAHVHASRTRCTELLGVRSVAWTLAALAGGSWARRVVMGPPGASCRATVLGASPGRSSACSSSASGPDDDREYAAGTIRSTLTACPRAASPWWRPRRR